MGKFFVSSAGSSLRLPATADLNGLRKELDEAATEQRSVVIRCEMEDDPRNMMDVRVNPHAHAWWGVVELPD